MANIGEKYVEACGRQLHQGIRIENKGRTDFTSSKKLPHEQLTDKPKIVPVCYNCKKEHLISDFKFPKKTTPNQEFKCFGCGKILH